MTLGGQDSPFCWRLAPSSNRHIAAKMHYGIVGLNHKTASVSIREQIALSSNQLQDALNHASRSVHIPETVILSTCNRVEFYTASPNPGTTNTALWNIVEEVCQLPRGSFKNFRPYLYDFNDNDAIRHLFRVACSLDSMVLGEPQILGQLKSAYQTAVKANTVGHYLGRGMERAFRIAKRVRTETQIGASGVSISYVAAQLAQKIFGSLHNKSILLVGAGDMAELAARHLVAQGASRPVIANRSLGRAQTLADALGGTARTLEALPELLIGTDIVITSTGATRPILQRNTLAGIMRARKYRPLFLIDIAVPRDIESAAGDLDNVYLYDIDDLEQIVAANKKERQSEADKAETIVTDEVERFRQWCEEADVVPTIVAMRKHFHSVKDQELEKAITRLAHLNARDQKAVQALAHALTNKLLHTPTMQLKRQAANKTITQESVDLIHSLFDLPEEDEPASS